MIDYSSIIKAAIESITSLLTAVLSKGSGNRIDLKDDFSHPPPLTLGDLKDLEPAAQSALINREAQRLEHQLSERVDDPAARYELQMLAHVATSLAIQSLQNEIQVLRQDISDLRRRIES